MIPGSIVGGVVPARTVALLAVSAGLHWGAWRAIDGPPGPGGGAGAPRVTWVVPKAAEAMPTRVATMPTQLEAMPTPVATMPTPVATMPTPVATMPTPVAVAPARSASGPASTEALRSGGARRAAGDARAVGIGEAVRAREAPPSDWFEVWQVDEPPQFLVAPDDLDELARRVGEPLHARVSLRIGSDGRLADIEVQADGTGPAARAALLEALHAAFGGVAFLPGRRDGRPVPVVQRWQLAIDPHVPVMLGLRPLD